MLKKSLCHIYLYSIPDNFDPDTISLLKKRVSISRLKKSEKYVNRKDGIKCILGGNLIRYSINKTFKLSFSSIQFSRNNYGKPFINGREDIHFSLSYTDGWIGCAVGTEPVGFDIEMEKEIDLTIAKRFFTYDENRYITGSGDDKKKSRFFEIWTLKESYIKAIGKGLTCPLNSFSIKKTRKHITIETSQHIYPMMNFQIIPLGTNYHCALCYFPKSVPSNPVYISSRNLIKGDT